MEIPTLGAALDRYLKTVTPRKKDHRMETYRIRRWSQNPLADRTLSTLRGVDFAAYRDTRLAQGVATNTVRLELAIISNLYTVCATDWGHEELQNPIRKIRLPKPSRSRERRLNQGEETALIRAADAVDSRLPPIIRFALATAMRRAEIAGLRWENVSFSRRAAVLYDTKNSETRTVPLSKKAIEILEAVKAPAGKVFRVSPDWITRRFKAATREAGIVDFHFHDLRHEATSRLFELDRLTVVEISMITGHKDLHMLKRYTHLTAAKLAAKLD